MRWSACIEMLFIEETRFAERIRRARAAGFEAVEFWGWSGKDCGAIADALAETGLPLAGMLCEPVANLANPETHDFFLAGLEASLAAARRLGAPLLIAQGGNGVAGASRAMQQDAIIACLGRAAGLLAGTGVVLALEPLNDRVDHPGYFVTSTVAGLDIVDAVGRPEVRLLYDLYHAAVMEEPVELLAGRLDRVVHVHLADAPGRHEPGSGRLDWRARLDWLAAQGYGGRIGLEYRPTGATAASLGFLDALG